MELLTSNFLVARGNQSSLENLDLILLFSIQSKGQRSNKCKDMKI